MIIKVPNPGTGGQRTLSLRCPSCRQQGTFEPFVNISDVQQGTTCLGHRRCPNPECRAHIFVVFDASSATLQMSYPAERIDFDSSNIPKALVDALEEAITCHANRCFTAAAIMVRKSLEELCRDRDADGDHLKVRLQALASKVVLPSELMTGLDDLRLLGNDAAHLESQAYEQVGQEEVEVGIMFTKEVLKAVYQYQNLLGRLRSLKKKP